MQLSFEAFPLQVSSALLASVLGARNIYGGDGNPQRPLGAAPSLFHDDAVVIIY